MIDRWTEDGKPLACLNCFVTTKAVCTFNPKTTVRLSQTESPESEDDLGSHTAMTHAHGGLEDTAGASTHLSPFRLPDSPPLSAQRDARSSETPRDLKRRRIDPLPPDQPTESPTPTRPNTKEWLQTYQQRVEAPKDKGKALQIGNVGLMAFQSPSLRDLRSQPGTASLPSVPLPSPSPTKSSALPGGSSLVPAPESPIRRLGAEIRHAYDGSVDFLLAATSRFQNEREILWGSVQAADKRLNEAAAAKNQAETDTQAARAQAKIAETDLKLFSKRCAEQAELIVSLRREATALQAAAEEAEVNFGQAKGEMDHKVQVANRACDRAVAEAASAEALNTAATDEAVRLRVEMDLAREIVVDAQAERAAGEVKVVGLEARISELEHQVGELQRAELAFAAMPARIEALEDLANGLTWGE